MHAEGPPADIPPYHEPERRSNTLTLLGAAVALLVVAAVAVAIVLLTGGDAKKQGTRPGGNETTSATRGSTPAEHVPVVTSHEIARVLGRYQDAYSREDAGALSRMFADDFVRRNGSAPAEDREQALDTYRGQFRALGNPQYTLSDVRFEEAAGEGAAAGHYTITHDTGASDGSITFHLRVVSGRGLQVDRITIQPS